MTETRAIHPQTNRIFAESPYTRKIKRLMEDVKTLESVAPLDDKLDIINIENLLEALLQRQHQGE